MNMKTTLFQKVLRILLAIVMILAGTGHLVFQREEYQELVPKWLAHDLALVEFVVISSGIVEIVLGLAMIFLLRHQVKVGIVLALFYVLIFPANIFQYTNSIDAFGLDTDMKRLLRLFFQPVFVFWALWSTGALSHLRSQMRSGGSTP